MAEKDEPRENRSAVHGWLHFAEQNLFHFHPGCLPKFKHLAIKKKHWPQKIEPQYKRTKCFYWHISDFGVVYCRFSEVLQVRIVDVSSSVSTGLGAVKVMLKWQLKQRMSLVKSSWRLQTNALTHPVRLLRTNIFWQHRRGNSLLLLKILSSLQKIWLTSSWHVLNVKAATDSTTVHHQFSSASVNVYFIESVFCLQI